MVEMGDSVCVDVSVGRVVSVDYHEPADESNVHVRECCFSVWCTGQ